VALETVRNISFLSTVLELYSADKTLTSYVHFNIEEKLPDDGPYAAEKCFEKEYI
jgi:hypothetical protein